MVAFWKTLGERVMTVLLSAVLLAAIAANGALVWTLSRQIVVGIETLQAERPVVILGVELDRARVPRNGALTYHVEAIRTRADCVGAGVTRWLISATGWQHRLAEDARDPLGEPGHALHTITLPLPELPARGGNSWRLMSTLSFACDEGLRHVRFSTPYFELTAPGAASEAGR